MNCRTAFVFCKLFVNERRLSNILYFLADKLTLHLKVQFKDNKVFYLFGIIIAQTIILYGKVQ